MPAFMLEHRHDPRDCGAVFAAWTGLDSPLRGTRALCSCAAGGHQLWFVVEAPDAATALGHLPPYLAERADAVPVAEVTIP